MTLTGFPKNHTTQSIMMYLLASYHYTLTISKRKKRSQHHTIKTYHYTLSVMSASRLNDIPYRSYQQVA